MGRYILKRLYFSIFVLIGASLIAFFLMRLAPGNPARMMLSDMATEQEVLDMEIKMGLDKPIMVQYFIFIKNTITGDFGTSVFYKRPCLELIMQRLPSTAILALGALIFSLSISFPMGITAGVNKGSFIDMVSMFFALIGQSISQVWLGLLLILVFAVHLGWFPTQGSAESIRSMVLPSIALGMALTSTVTRQLRSGMYDVLQEDYITCTLSRGIPRRTVYTKYALKNAMLTVVTVLGIQIGILLCGSIVVESIFGWPGIGGLLIKAINLRDYPLVQAILFISSCIFVVINLLVDIVYTIVDPRMRLS